LERTKAATQAADRGLNTLPSKPPVHLIAVVGARPNFVKMSAIVARLREHPAFRLTLLHTRQHYDDNLSGVFFEQLELPVPDVVLEIPRGSHAAQTAGIMREFDTALDHLPDAAAIIVVGDVNSTLAASLVAVKRHLRVIHVEAGLRSFNWSMPEEINRVITDRISDLLFTTSEDADRNLRLEGIPPERIHMVGNVMIDTLLSHREQARACRSAEKLGLDGDYAVVTLHRQENVDDQEILWGLIRSLTETSKRLPVIFPAHPRTQKRLAEDKLWSALEDEPRIRVVEPMGYLEFLDLVAGARLVLTDSGGLQEETTVLGVPCLTLRGETERPITVSHGTNQVVGVEQTRIVAAVDATLKAAPAESTIPPLWDGQAAGRVAKVLERVLGSG
jgi:UDP-N-acetylglucosamine 2-epimerase (non-hydrolysing)